MDRYRRDREEERERSGGGGGEGERERKGKGGSKEGGRKNGERESSYMIKQAVLPALEDDIVSDVSVDERREAILVGRGGDLDGIGND